MICYSKNMNINKLMTLAYLVEGDEIRNTLRIIRRLEQEIVSILSKYRVVEIICCLNKSFSVPLPSYIVRKLEPTQLIHSVVRFIRVSVLQE